MRRCKRSRVEMYRLAVTKVMFLPPTRFGRSFHWPEVSPPFHNAEMTFSIFGRRNGATRVLGGHIDPRPANRRDRPSLGGPSR